MAELPQPVFLGFVPKAPLAPKDGVDARVWLVVDEVFAVSDCLRSHPNPDWIDRWDFNRAGCYDSAEAALIAAGEANRPTTTVLALWWLPLTCEDGVWREVQPAEVFSADLPALPVPSSDAIGVELGWDVVAIEGGDTLGFGCSPLSCNGLANEEGSNRWALVGSVDEAVRLVRVFQDEQPEPGTYWAVRVVRVAGP